MNEWAGELARAYAACRATHPEDTAVLVVDDQTLLDERSRPRPGVADVVRLFEMQPLTRVAVVSDKRPEDLDAALRDYDVAFDPAFVRPSEQDLRQDGHQIAARIDSPPERRDDGGPVEPDEPVELVWHRVNHPIVLRQFLASPIRWAEIDVRLDDRGRLIVHHGDLDTGADDEDDHTTADEIFDEFRQAGKGLNLDIKDPDALGATLDGVADHGFPDEDVWANGRIDQLGEDGMRSVKKRFPNSRLQCPLEFLGQVAAAMPDEARRIVDRVRSWGVDRFSLAWTHPDTPMLRDRLDDWGLDTNLYAITDLEQVLAAVVTVPRSLTADFTLPEWHYFGRGGGNDGEFHRDPHEAAKDPPGIDLA
jgi:hypothetical protein